MLTAPFSGVLFPAQTPVNAAPIRGGIRFNQEKILI